MVFLFPKRYVRGPVDGFFREQLLPEGGGQWVVSSSVMHYFPSMLSLSSINSMLEEISDSGLNCFCETASNRAGRCRLNVEEKVKLTLGQYLASIRLDRNLSLRQVEEKSNKAVSNAYLSQLETGKILQPNPTVLNALAEVYDISYLQLMKLAGYLPPSASSEPSQRHGRLATFAEHNLTPEEEKELMDFLQYLRSKKQP